jgi:hypothetical protein
MDDSITHISDRAQDGDSIPLVAGSVTVTNNQLADEHRQYPNDSTSLTMPMEQFSETHRMSLLHCQCHGVLIVDSDEL